MDSSIGEEEWVFLHFGLGFDKREVSHNLIKRFFSMPTKNTYSRKTRLNLSLEL